MTTIHEEEVTCAVCGETQTVAELGSTNSFGAMDLDTRPPEMQRSTMDMWVHECESCGFVAAELATVRPTDAAIVATSGYRAELENAGRSRLANRFVCLSMLDESAGDLMSAGWQRLHAAWECDDNEAVDNAGTLRREAIGLFERARATGARVMTAIIGGDELLLADLARRSREFEQGIEYCEAGLKLELDLFLRQLLTFEQQLCAARDTRCHTVDEVAPEDATPPRGRVH